MTTARVLTIAPTAPADTLVVFLHGVGSNADGFHAIAKELAPSLPHAELVIVDGFHPFDQGPSGRQWFSIRGINDANRAERVRGAGEEVSSWIDAELDRRKLGHDRLVLVGFSQGAIVSSWLSVHRTPRPRAVLMFSGLVGIASDEAPVAGVPVPVFMAHGDRDPVISVSVVDPGVRTLEAWGAQVTKHVYANLDHRIDGRELTDAKAFLAATLRGSVIAGAGPRRP